ncbi:MAG: ribbon-helix-helix domain-containing protein [Nanoarchaeota archaeon]|nr:ribbon-helix-helix domain-containing protein [Nanoarchaeota archaeon]
MRKYTNIPLPDDLIKQIESIIEKLELGYKTKSEFVKEAVREKIIKISEFKGIKKP